MLKSAKIRTVKSHFMVCKNPVKPLVLKGFTGFAVPVYQIYTPTCQRWKKPLNLFVFFDADRILTQILVQPVSRGLFAA